LIDQYEKDQKKFLKLKEKEIESLNQKIFNLEKTTNEIELKYKDALRELEMAKQNETKTNEFSFEESLKNNELNAKIMLQKNEIDDLKRNHKELISKYLEENYKLKEKLDVTEDKLLEVNILKNDNEKLKNKIKDYQKLKEKVSDYDNLLIIMNSKTKSIESLQNDKKALMTNLDKLQKELITEKDKVRNFEFEKKKLENDYQEARTLITRLENRLDSQLNKKESIVSKF
jgi:chromosome segregation ATPase